MKHMMVYIMPYQVLKCGALEANSNGLEFLQTTGQARNSFAKRLGISLARISRQHRGSRRKIQEIAASLSLLAMTRLIGR